MDVRVGIESTPKRAFASALDWPGWSRSGRDEEAAHAALDGHRERYRAALAAAGLAIPDDGPLRVVDRRPGDATTEFGAPAVSFAADQLPTDEATATWLAATVAAAWETLARVVAGAPEMLRKGPRGGGRDRDAIVEHVVLADHAYARMLGVRLPAPRDPAALAALRSAMLDALRLPSDGGVREGARWTTRYGARRIAWHALDHAWEIEDRSTP